MLTTYADLVDHLFDYGGASASAPDERYSRAAVQAAVNQLPQMRHWNYYYSPWLQITNASQRTSTITYDHEGGLYDRMVTIASGTWPSWASLGVIRINQVDYEVAERKSSTVITLSANTNPGSDIAAGTEYVIYRNAYPLPTDYMSLGPVINQTNQTRLVYIDPSEWHDRAVYQYGPGLPICYTIMGSRNYLNTMTMFLYPAPDSAYSLAGIYQRRLRPITIHDETAGKVTVTSSSTTVTGTGTAFTSYMVGSVIRFHADTDNPPTALGGAYPFQVERMITAVADANTLTIDAVTGQAYTNVKYRISDPVDIREANMLNLLLRECERQYRVRKRMTATRDEIAATEQDKMQAYESDRPSFELQHAGGSLLPFSSLPLRYYPLAE